MSVFSAPTCERAPRWLAAPAPDRQWCPLAERRPIQGLWHLHFSVFLTRCSLWHPKRLKMREGRGRESQRRGPGSLGSRTWLSWPQGTFSVGSWQVEICKLEKLGFSSFRLESCTSLSKSYPFSGHRDAGLGSSTYCLWASHCLSELIRDDSAIGRTVENQHLLIAYCVGNTQIHTRTRTVIIYIATIIVGSSLSSS